VSVVCEGHKEVLTVKFADSGAKKKLQQRQWLESTPIVRAVSPPGLCSAQSCPWVGLTHGLGWVGSGQSADRLGWVGSHKMDPWTTLVLPLFYIYF